MTAIVETVLGGSLIVTVAAIMVAHHLENRLDKRIVLNGNRYHRFDQKEHRLAARLSGRAIPARHYCKNGCPLD